MIDNTVLTAYQAQRAKGYGAKTAFEIAKGSTRTPEHEFLSDLDVDKMVTGEIGPFVVEVKIVRDEESRLGEDDATGWFTDDFEDGCVKNTRRDWGTDYKYYHPSNYTLQHAYDDARKAGMSKQVAREHVAEVIDQEMYDDANREYYGVSVRVSIGTRELGHASLWGIDTIPGYDPLPYFIETVAELIDEALDEARKAVPTALRKTITEAGTLASALDTNH